MVDHGGAVGALDRGWGAAVGAAEAADDVR
jgi:hypothetical protein